MMMVMVVVAVIVMMIVLVVMVVVVMMVACVMVLVVVMMDLHPTYVSMKLKGGDGSGGDGVCHGDGDYDSCDDDGGVAMMAL